MSPNQADADSASHDGPNFDASADGSPGMLSWDLATFAASTTKTGKARVEFQVSVGNDVGLQPSGPWMSQADVRALGALDGRYLALSARLVSPDGWGAASLGRITVQGTHGRAEWLVAGRAPRTLAQSDGLVSRGGALTLQQALAQASRGLPVDSFEDGVVDDALWANHLSHAVDLVEQGGVLRVRTTGGIGAGTSVMGSTLAIRGDFEIQVDHVAETWPMAVGATVHQAGVAVTTETDRCTIRRRSAGDARTIDLWHSETGDAVGTVADAAGLLSMRLVRSGSDVTAAIRRGGVGAWQPLGTCALGKADGVFEINLDPGYAAGLGEPIQIAVDNYEVRSAGAIVGYDRTSPQVQFETEDALLPRVEISPGSLVFPEAVTVTLAATPSDSTIFYSVDGTDPTSSTTRRAYENPFELRSSAQVRAVAVTPSGQTGWHASEQYFIGQALARAPLDGSGSVVAETVQGWNGVNLGAERDVSGKVGRATRFNGIRSYLELPDSTADGSSAYQVDSGAVAIWFKPSRLDGKATIVSKDSNGYDTGGHLTVTIDNAEIAVRLQSLDSGHHLRTRAAPLQSGMWHRLAVLFGRPSLTILLWDQGATLVGRWSEDYYGGLGVGLGEAGNREPFALGTGTSLSDGQVTTPMGMTFSGDLDEFLYLSL